MAASRKNEPPGDAIALLKADHRTVEELFEKFEKAGGSAQKSRLAEKICLELSVHTEIEEEIFYPAVRGGVEDDLLDESHVEHDSAKLLIADIHAGNPSQPFYDAKVKVLSELIKHHVKEEEGWGGLFSQAKKADVDLDSLGEEMWNSKQELTARYKRGLPTLVIRAMRKPRIKVGRPAK